MSSLGVRRSARSARLLNRRDDVGVRAATTDVATHAFPDVGVRWAARLAEQCDGGHDLPRRAVAALVAVVLDERRLYGMQRPGFSDSLDRGDLIAFVHDGERQTGRDSPSIDVHGACAALPM